MIAGSFTRARAIGDALLLAAGELRGRVVPAVGEADASRGASRLRELLGVRAAGLRE